MRNPTLSRAGDGVLDVPFPAGKQVIPVSISRLREKTGAATAAPAEMSFFGVYLSNQHNVGVDQRRGEVPSFAVSIRGIPKGGRNRNLPPFGVLSLFVHFLFARAKRKWTLTGPFSSKSTLTEIRQGAFGLCCVWVGVCRVNGDPCGESGLREDLCSDDNAFSREYFVYFKKKRRRQGANHPQGAEDVWVGVCLYS